MVVFDFKHETLEDNFLCGEFGEGEFVKEVPKVGEGAPRKLAFSKWSRHCDE